MKRKGEPTEEKTTIGCKETLQTKVGKGIAGMGVSELYARLVANMWELPTKFEEGRTARKIWDTLGRPVKKLHGDVKKIYSGIRHPAVPRGMSDKSLWNATCSDISSRMRLPCPRCAAPDSTEHKYRSCPEVANAWRMGLGAWNKWTGEHLSPADESITAWGARWLTWDTKEKAEAHGGEEKEEVFRVMHSAMISAIDKLHKKNTKGHHIYMSMQNTVQAVVNDRMRAAGSKFMTTWIEPGYATLVPGRKTTARVCLWGSKGEKERTPADPDTPKIDISTDGSAMDGKAGWGFVAAIEEMEIHTDRGPVNTEKDSEGWEGANNATNNSAELLGVTKALSWATSLQEAHTITIRYDSKYAALMTQGTWKPRGKGGNAPANVELISRAKDMLGEAEKRHVIKWEWVKGHSGDTWNERADKLADEGREMSTSPAEAPRKREGKPRPKGNPPGDLRTVGGVRGVSYAANETRRVRLSQTRWGCLNRRATPQIIHRKDIETLVREAREEIIEDRRREIETEEEARASIAKVSRCGVELGEKKTQQGEWKKWRSKRFTRSKECVVNANGLEQIVITHGEETKGMRGRGGAASTWEDAVAELFAAGTPEQEGSRMRSTTWYVYSEVGRMLYEAGHVTGSREYSDTIDPFQWPEKLREAAFWGIGTELDDSSAYPRALLAMTRDTGACAQFVREKETITREYGRLMLPDSEWAEQKKCVKQAVNAIDMDGGIDAWKAKFPASKYPKVIKTLKNTSVKDSTGKDFSMEKYRETQLTATKYIEKGAKRMIECIRSVQNVGSKKWDKASLTAKSYILQEAEATSREAKLWECKKRGIQVGSLQHDGILCYVRKEEEAGAVERCRRQHQQHAGTQ